MLQVDRLQDTVDQLGNQLLQDTVDQLGNQLLQDNVDKLGNQLLQDNVDQLGNQLLHQPPLHPPPDSGNPFLPISSLKNGSLKNCF